MNLFTELHVITRHPFTINNYSDTYVQLTRKS